MASLHSPPPGILVPVAGISPDRLRDSWGAPRSGGRWHKGIDIFAPPGTPVVAAVPGTVTLSGPSGGLGGTRVWVRGDDGRYYYYAHLSFTSVQAGQRVEAGHVLGGVGNTGNARTTPAHLHFSINTRQGAETGDINPFHVLSGGHAHHGHAHGFTPPPPGPTPEQLAEAQRIRERAQKLREEADAIEASVSQTQQNQVAATEAHQQRTLQVMQMMQGRRELGGSGVPLMEPVSMEAFQTQPFSERLQELAPRDLTPQVARRQIAQQGDSRRKRLQELTGLRLPEWQLPEEEDDLLPELRRRR